MSDYKRLVAYIYLYDNGARAKNIGFTKVEAKEGRLRIQVHIKGAWAVEGNVCDAYIFYRKKEFLNGIFIGRFPVTGGSGALNVLTESENVMESGRVFSGMAGIIMKASSGRYLATRWDDELLNLENFTLHDDQMAEETVCMQEVLPEENAPEIPENPEADSENPMDGAETEAEFRTAEPADLLVYGSWGRRLVNNSFLLHGYYNYGHLLFGMEDGMEFLGVPGEFCLQEKMMAALFGFPEFRTIDTFERETGNTGYWLRRLDYGSAGKIHESGDRAGQKGI